MKRRLFDLFEWLGRHELMVLLAVLIVVAGTWGFIALADVVLEGRTQPFDESLLRALRRPDDPAMPIGPGWMAEVGRDLDRAGRRRRAALGDLGRGRLSPLGSQVRRHGVRAGRRGQRAGAQLGLEGLLRASAAGGRAAPVPGLHQQFPQRALDDVGHRLFDSRGLAGTDDRPAPAEGLFPCRGLHPYGDGGVQSRLHGRPLPDRRPGRLDGRAGLGQPLLARGAGDCNAAARSRNTSERSARAMLPTRGQQQTAWYRRYAARIAAHWRFKLFGGGLITVGFFAGYFLLQRFPVFPVTEMPSTALDRLIGFCPETLVLYATLWLYMAIAPWSLDDKQELTAYCRAVIAITAGGLAVFFLWPTCVPSPIDYGQHAAYACLYAIDHRNNAAPSLHAAIAVFSAFCIQHRLRHFRQRAVWHLGNWCWCAAILYSTLATKQHVAVDLLSGLLLGVAACGIYPGWSNLFSREFP